MSLTTFVSRKFAEIDSVHRVPAPDLRWAGDTTQIKLMLEEGKKTCVDECYKITEEMMEQSLELLKDDIEHLSDKIDWMTSNTEQTFELWRIEKTIEEIEHQLNRFSLATSEEEHSFVSDCESHAEELLAELQYADQSTDNRDEEEPPDETTQHEDHATNKTIVQSFLDPWGNTVFYQLPPEIPTEQKLEAEHLPLFTIETSFTPDEPIGPPTYRSTVPGFNYPTPTSIMSYDYWNDDYAQANAEWELAGNDGNFIGAENNFWTTPQSESEWHNEQLSHVSDQYSPCNEEIAAFTFDFGCVSDPCDPDAEEESNSTTATDTPEQQTPRNKLTHHCKRKRRSAARNSTH